MSEPSLWWLLTGALVALELLTGTFYLLMLALGGMAAAIAAHAGVSLTGQLSIAACVGGGAVVAWHGVHQRRRQQPAAQADPDLHLDIGETVHIATWNPDGTASVQYRGAHWTAMHRTGVLPSPGAHRVAELVGNRLLVDKT
jgi:membrane protein implicated in regulation of membrane protease activity